MLECLRIFFVNYFLVVLLVTSKAFAYTLNPNSLSLDNYSTNRLQGSLAFIGEAQKSNVIKKKQKVEIVPGSIFNAVIRLWNYSNENLPQKKDFIGTTIMSTLYVLNISKIQLSENNPEVLEVFGTFIYSKITIPTTYLAFAGDFVPIKYENLIFVGGDKQDLIDGFGFLDQPTSSSLWWVWAIILVIITFLVCVSMYIFRKVVKARYERTRRTTFENVTREINTARTRSELQAIYDKRKEFRKDFPQITFRNFSLDMYQRQYKREWSSEDTSLIINSLQDDLKGISYDKL